MKGVIYCYHCISTGKKYIGQTINEKHRKSTHICKAKTDCNFLFYRAVRKYGWENFIYGIIDTFDENWLNEKEIYFIEKYDTFNNGYNTTVGGEGSRGRVRTEEELKKFSQKMKGRKKTEEHKSKISKAHLDLNKKGIPLSEEHKKNLKLASKGKRGGENNNFYDKRHSTELKERWSKDRKNIPYWNNGQKNKRSVECPGKGWVRGTLKKGKWWNDGTKNILSKEYPGNDWKPGKITNKIYIFTSPQGNELEVKNLFSFCLEYGLDNSTIRKLFKKEKKYQSHKGWKFKECIFNQ